MSTRPLRSIGDFVRAFYTIAWSSSCITIALLVTLVTRRSGPALTMARKIWAPGLLRGGPVELDIRGLEKIDPERRYLVTANHQSIVDIPALFAALPMPIRFVARSNLGGVPFLGQYMRSVGMVLLDRESSTSARAAVDAATEILSSESSLVTFPEGTRTTDGSIQRFKRGAVVPAIRAGVPIVPVAIVGAFEIVRRGGFHPRPGRVTLSIGDPIATDGRTEDDRAELAQSAEDAVRALANAARPAPTPGEHTPL